MFLIKNVTLEKTISSQVFLEDFPTVHDITNFLKAENILLLQETKKIKRYVYFHLEADL